MSEEINKRLQEFGSKVASMTASVTLPELKQKKIDRDAEYKIASEKAEAEAAKVKVYHYHLINNYN